MAKIKIKAFEGHQGRPGMVGGSVPRGSASGEISIGGSGNATYPSFAMTRKFDAKLKSIYKRGSGDVYSAYTGVRIGRDPDLERILKEGEEFNGAGKYKYKMEDAHCHWNTAKLYAEGKIDAIVIGYSVNDHTKNWIQHTWGIKNNSVVETTRENFNNNYYFGLRLSPAEANAFVAWTSANPPGGGKVRSYTGDMTASAFDDEGFSIANFG